MSVLTNSQHHRAVGDFAREARAKAQVGLLHVRLGRQRLHLTPGDARDRLRMLSSRYEFPATKISLNISGKAFPRSPIFSNSFLKVLLFRTSIFQYYYTFYCFYKYST